MIKILVIFFSLLQLSYAQEITEEESLPVIKEEIKRSTKLIEDLKTNLEKDIEEDSLKLKKEDEYKKRELNLLFSKYKKIKLKLLNQKIKLNQALEKKITDYDETREKLSKLSLEVSPALKQRKKDFEQIEAIWISINTNNFFELLKSDMAFKLPEIPELPSDMTDFTTSEIKELKKQRIELIKTKDEFVQELTTKKEREIKLLNSLFMRVNQLRSTYFNTFSGAFALEKIFSLEGMILIKNEVMATPYRFISYGLSKYFYISDKLSKGRNGITELVVQIFKILALIVIFFSLKMGILRSIEYLNDFFRNLINRNRSSFFLKKITSFWHKIKDNLSSIIWIIILEYLERIPAFSELSILLDLGQIYLTANILKSLLVLFLGSVSIIEVKRFSSFKKKAQHTSQKFYEIFLIYFISMAIFEVTVGKVYIYSIFQCVVLLYSFIQVINSSALWEKEFKEYLEKKFSGMIIDKLFLVIKVFPRKFQTTIIFFAILILSVIDLFIKTTENFEISKKVSANFFKKQIEMIEAEEGADNRIPQDYKDLFYFKSLEDAPEYVVFDERFETKIKEEIIEWLGEKSDEHNLLLYGDKGVGKTSFLKHIASSVSEEYKLEYRYAKMPSKVLSEKDITNFFKTDVWCSEEVSDLMAFDEKLETKTIIVIDEAQNVFLSETGGFKAYYYFIDLINQNTKNIFWVLSFNKYSWLYLDRAFGRNQFFRNVYELKGWGDDKIKELIMKRHEKSEYSLSYDLLINATRSQDEIDKYTSIENKFFKLLWELSQGNPRTALFLWLTALSRKRKNSFNVNIPKELELNDMQKLNDNILFVLAHILKHENLNAAEIERTTNFAPGIVRNSLKVAFERKFLYEDSRKRFMLDITAQHGLIKYLRIKNFIYGN